MHKLIFSILLISLTLTIKGQKFEVSYSENVLSENFTGNILLYLSKENKQPKDAFIATELPPVFRIEVNDLAPDQAVIFDDSAISYPVALSNIERGMYYAQVVIDRNLGGQNISQSPGNIYSDPIKVSIDKNFDATFNITCNKVIDDIPFKESALLKELKVKSNLLSDFHDKDVFIAGAVSLPEGYHKNKKAKYPVIFSIFGFGANYKIHAGHSKYRFTKISNEPVIVVYLDGNCPEGHSTYANSDINGPWADALIKEFIPVLEKNYRTNNATFLFGHSSGGWTSLWLQINYPDIFAGTWSSAPDQVDFRNWQGKNIYEAKNMFYDENGRLAAEILMGGRYPIISAKDLYQIENVIYRGEQVHSFDAVFSNRNDNGEIIRLADPTNGNINPSSIEYLKRYDISYLLRNNWKAYKNDLSGKLRISIGEADNFHLHKAVYLFEEEMKKLESDVIFEYFTGDHFTVFTEEYKSKGQQFLDECYKNWLAANSK